MVNPPVPAPAVPSGLEGLSVEDLAELKRKLDFQAEKKRVQAKGQQDREEDAKILWPSDKLHREFLRGTGGMRRRPSTPRWPTSSTIPSSWPSGRSSR